MDAVYILGTGSIAKNAEIKYSVRSLARYMHDLNDVYIVGENPENLPNAGHIPASDTSKTKWHNSYHKIKKVCGIADISDPFLLMNDDFFLLADFLGSEWPFYATKNGNGGPAGPYDFAIHAPLQISKEYYLKMPELPLKIKQYSPRSFYCNFYKAPPTFCKDFVLRVGPEHRPFDDQIAGWPSFSISDSAMIYQDFLDWLDSLYPDSSKFE